MKSKFLIGALIVSVLFNIAGIVFLCCYIDARGDLKSMKKERSRLTHDLTEAQEAANTTLLSSAQAQADARAASEAQMKAGFGPAATLSGITGAERVEKRSFISLHDGFADQVAVLMPPPPTVPRDCTLIVYLHGMGADCLEPYLSPPGITMAKAFQTVDTNTVVLSCSYRKPASWGNDAAIADINQNIRSVLQEIPCKQIVIAGTSMGGCTALNYAAVAPPDIREKMIGVIAVEGAGDIGALYTKTQVDVLRTAMQTAYGGTPQQVPTVYRDKSFVTNVDKLPITTRVVIVTADQDVIVPTPLQMDVVGLLQSKKYPLLHIPVRGAHHIPEWNVYANAYRFVLGKA